MGVRICTLGVPQFRHGGLEVGERWQTVAKVDEKQRVALRDYHGRFIQVHPEDREKLSELGLGFKSAGERLVDAAKKSAAPPKGDDKKSNSTNGGSKADEKKG